MKTLTTLLAFVFGFGLLAQSVTVVNTQDAGAGSLRQAIIDANANHSIDSIHFNIPNTDGNYNAINGVYTIKINSATLPAITNPNLVVDGYSQSAFNGNTNTTMFGTGGTVGCDSLTLDKVDGPEIEISDDGGYAHGLIVESNNVKLLNIAVNGFSNNWFTSLDANIIVRAGGRNFHMEDCVVGSRAHISLPPLSDVNGGNNLLALSADSGTVHNNFIAYAESMGTLIKNGCTGWTFTNNEFYSNGMAADVTDGLDIANNTYGNTVTGNLFKYNGGAGFDSYLSYGDLYVANNTCTENGQLHREISGMRIYGNQGGTIYKNLIYDNVGAGIMVTSEAEDYEITENVFYGNGNMVGSGGTSTTNQIAIDLLAGTDDHEEGTSPYFTLNDDGDGDLGGNKLLNFAVIESAEITGSSVTVKGFAPAGARIEFYKGNLYTGATYPQGEMFMFAKTEGSGDDADATTGSYGPGNVNGIAQGTETSVNRFEFTATLPAGCTAGDIITATAYVSGHGTSEFCPGYSMIHSGSTSVTPNLNCVYIDVNGDLVASFGYNNPTGSTVHEPIGSDNKFSPGSQNQGQPTSFSNGLVSNAFTVTFPIGQSRTWTLHGTSVTADSSSVFCPVDLEVTQTASNNTPSVGDLVTFTITIDNLTSGTPATDVLMEYLIDTNFTFVSYNAFSGTYNSTTHEWSIPEVLFGAPAVLEIVVQVNGTGTNVANILSQNQPDPNTGNNSASETCTTDSGSSGGNNGGIESEGSMGQLIAHRNFDRLKTGAHHFYDEIGELQTLSSAKMMQTESSSAVMDFLPTYGPQNTTALISTPTDLLNITNAVDVLSADYFKANNDRLGVIMVMETANDVYNHTKVVCDRLNGATLSNVSYATVDGMPFIVNRLDQENGEIDYSIVFVAYQKANGEFVIDNRFTLGAYNPPANSQIFNFQVWSVSESTTKELAQDVIDLIKSKGNVSYLNTGAPILPTVYVESGKYENGVLSLDIVNTVGASQIHLDANSIGSETSNRGYFTTTVNLDPSKTKETVDWNVGYIFDAGFAITNNKGGGTDVLYFADGAWGADYEDNIGATSVMYDAYQETGYTPDPSVKELERGVSYSANLKNYVSLFRMFHSGNRTADLSAYNQVEFEASLSGMNEMVVTLVSESIQNWHDQYKVTVPVTTTGINTYTLDFENFESISGKPLRVDDLVNITFTVIGDQNTYKAMNISVDNVRFLNNGIGIDENEVSANDRISIYPNPFSAATNIDFEVVKSGEVMIEMYDISGKIVDRQNLGYHIEGVNNFIYSPGNELNNGIYLMKVTDPARSVTKQVVYKK